MTTTSDPSDPRLTRGVDDEPTSQAAVYLVLTPAERAAGFVRPLRRSYRHVATCNSITTMAPAIAETYAANPTFYGATFCVTCQMHRPLSEFRWIERDGSTGPTVGS